MTRSAVHFYWLLYGSLSMWTYWSDQVAITGDQWADQVLIDGAKAEDEVDLSSRVTETEGRGQSINDWSGCCSWWPGWGGRSLSAGPQRSASFRFSRPRLWPLSCERPAGGSRYTWTSSPTALPHLRRLPTSWNQQGCSEAPPPTRLLWIQGFPKPSRLKQEGFWLRFNRSGWFLRQPVRAMMEYLIFKYKKHLSFQDYKPHQAAIINAALIICLLWLWCRIFRLKQQTRKHLKIIFLVNVRLLYLFFAPRETSVNLNSFKHFQNKIKSV